MGISNAGPTRENTAEGTKSTVFFDIVGQGTFILDISIGVFDLLGELIDAIPFSARTVYTRVPTYLHVDLEGALNYVVPNFLTARQLGTPISTDDACPDR